MSPKILGFVVFCWIIGVLLGSIYDNRTDLCETDTAGEDHCYGTTIEYLMDTKNIISHIGVAQVSIPVPNPSYISVLVQALTMQFSFLHGQWFLVWLIICLPIVAMSIFALFTWAMQLLQGFVPNI